MNRRTLSLRREALAELADDDLRAAAGASAMGATCDFLKCATVMDLATVCHLCNLFTDKVC